jgi:hypothetical protein
VFNIVAKIVSLVHLQITVIQENYSLSSQLGAELPPKMIMLLPDHGPQGFANRVQLLLGTQAVWTRLSDKVSLLVFQGCHPHHKELIKVVTKAA